MQIVYLLVCLGIQGTSMVSTHYTVPRLTNGNTNTYQGARHETKLGNGNRIWSVYLGIQGTVTITMLG